MVRPADPIPAIPGYAVCRRHSLGGKIPWTCRRCEAEGRPQDAQERPAVAKRATKRRAAGQAVEDALWAALGPLRDGCIRQFAWAVDEGRRFAADFGWPDARLLVEVKGGVHSIKRNSRKDMEREALAAALGWRVLPLHKGMIEDGTGVALIERALGVGVQ